MDERRGLLLRGRVQGVAFRWWTRELARELGLHGTVRNLPDGSVEVHVSGASGPLAEFLARLRNGPRRADVKSIEEIPFDVPLEPGFHILL